MSQTLHRREQQREALVAAAETTIAAHGLAGLKARELAAQIGCSLGAIYNLVQDMDELVLRVGSRTLARLDETLDRAAGAGEPTSPAAATDRLVAVALAYCAFAGGNLKLWRTLFEHRMAEDSIVPEWAVSEQIRLFRHIVAPLAMLLPETDDDRIALLSRTLFSAVHGVVTIGLEEKLVAVPRAALEGQVELLVRLLCAGLSQDRQG